jgi:FHA domain
VGFEPHSLSPAELARIRDAERMGDAFLTLRDPAGVLKIVGLGGQERLSIGRGADNDLALPWDPEISRAHAQLERVGAEWVLADDGLSRNGSFVNAERVVARRRLQDGDVIRTGSTQMVFRAPIVAGVSTAVAALPATAPVSAAERRVLVALCRPLLGDGAASGIPAGNDVIASELHLSLSGVKSQLQALFAKFALDDHPHYGKRTELARRAIASGVVTARDL